MFSAIKQARCKLFHKVFDLSNMERQALVSHTSGKMHAQHDVKVQTIFKVPSSDASKIWQDTLISTGSPSFSKAKSSLQLFVTNEMYHSS